MKRSILAVAMITALGLAGCSSTNPFGSQGMAPASDTTTPVKDTRISTDFTDEGIKIYYTLMGNLDRIEVYGIAPAWKGNVEILAEADAMDKLVKFVHGKSVSTERRVKIMAKAMDRARDNTLNKFKGADGSVDFSAKELESDSAALPSITNPEEATRDNTSRRIADRVENTLVNTVTTITAKGRLTGVRKVRDEVRQDGRIYVAVFQWSEKDQVTSEFIRGRMR